MERLVDRNGKFNVEHWSAALSTKLDVPETVLQESGRTTLDHVQAVVLERNGGVSLIRKQKADDVA